MGILAGVRASCDRASDGSMKIGGTVWGLARSAVRLKGCCGRTEAAVGVRLLCLPLWPMVGTVAKGG